VPLVDIIEGNAVKRSYQRALLSLHPDKLQQKGATSEQKYIAEKVFDILQVTCLLALPILAIAMQKKIITRLINIIRYVFTKIECLSIYLQCRRHGLNSIWSVHSNSCSMSTRE
jgi:hypothetical protein